MPDDQKIDQSANTADQETDNGEGEKNQQTDAGEGQGTDTEKISVATDTGNDDAGGGQDKGEGDNKETSKGQDKNAKVPPKILNKEATTELNQKYANDSLRKISLFSVNNANCQGRQKPNGKNIMQAKTMKLRQMTKL